MCVQWAFPFAKPVDTTIFKDYPIVITQPIDFATIKAKVDGTRYKQPQQFHADMKLVFANAKRYNPPGSDVNLMASGVEVSTQLSWTFLRPFHKRTHSCTAFTAHIRLWLDRHQACVSQKTLNQLVQHDA